MLRRQSLIVCSTLLLCVSCSNSSEKIEEKPLVYEGMSKNDLIINLGEPISKDSSSKVYDPVSKKMLAVEKWQYDKRTVLLINDTVKDPLIN